MTIYRISRRGGVFELALVLGSSSVPRQVQIRTWSETVRCWSNPKLFPSHRLFLLDTTALAALNSQQRAVVRVAGAAAKRLMRAAGGGR